MLKTIEVKWDLLGAELATLGADDQANFFKGFLYELSKFDSEYHTMLQLAHIVGQMDDKTKKLADKYLPSLTEQSVAG